MLLQQAYHEGTDLWACAQTEANVILLAPEQLEGDHFRTLLDSRGFSDRIYLLVVDEAHLTYTWSKSFRKAYGRIGQIRNRLERHTRLLLLTATLRSGAPYKAVMDTFDLVQGRFHDIHRSNLRPEIRVTTSIIGSSLTTSLNFPELRWIVGLQGISIIFVRDRSLALRIALYLKRIEPPYAHTIRKCDATNDPSYNKETQEAINKPDHDGGLILVATTILTLGIDIPNVVRVISVDPVEFDEEIQQMGRLLRQKEKGCVGEAYVYVSQTTMDKALAMVQADKAAKEGNGIPAQSKKATRKGKNNADTPQKSTSPTLSLSMAYRLVAPCVTVEQNDQYGNPVCDPPCSCQSCTSLGPTRNRCLCSGCQPGRCERDMVKRAKEGLLKAVQEAAKLRMEALPNDVRPDIEPLVFPLDVMIKLTDKGMRNHVQDKLVALRERMFDASHTNYSRYGLYTPEDMVPDAIIPLILDNFFRLETPEVLSALTHRYKLYPDWVQEIWAELRASMPRLLRIHAKALKRAKQKKVAAKQKARVKYLDKREATHGIRTALPTEDIPQFMGKRWRYFGRTFRLRLHTEVIPIDENCSSHSGTEPDEQESGSEVDVSELVSSDQEENDEEQRSEEESE